MPAVVREHSIPNGRWSDRLRYLSKAEGITVMEKTNGRAAITQIDLALPSFISEKLYYKKAAWILELLRQRGERYAILPRHMAALGAEMGLRPCDDLPVLRQIVARIVLAFLGERAEGSHIHISARKPDLCMVENIEQLAMRCRYLTLSGGTWAEDLARDLRRRYGIAPLGRAQICPDLWVCLQGSEIARGKAVLDLSGAKAGTIRPYLSMQDDWLPDLPMEDQSRLLGQLLWEKKLDMEKIEILFV